MRADEPPSDLLDNPVRPDQQHNTGDVNLSLLWALCLVFLSLWLFLFLPLLFKFQMYMPWELCLSGGFLLKVFVGYVQTCFSQIKDRRMML